MPELNKADIPPVRDPTVGRLCYRDDKTTKESVRLGLLNMNIRSIAAILTLILVGHAMADPIAPGAVRVIDGDTIAAHGQHVRLVGFDTPESGFKARCESERALAARATFRLRQLIAAGGLDLALVRCACRAGTEGTPACNYGRACGALLARGRDVGAILIGEGLARPYVCTGTHCQRRQSWCKSQ